MAIPNNLMDRELLKFVETYDGKPAVRFIPNEVDRATQGIITIDYAHHEIHSGSHYFYTDTVTLASSGTQDYLITTPNTTKWAHMLLAGIGSAITQFDLYEGSDRTGTSAQTVINQNRNSSNTAGVTIHKGTSSGTTDGVKIFTHKGGSSGGVSRTESSVRNDNEIILKQNTKYIFRVTSGTTDNITSVGFSWYEHTNKA